MEEKIIKILKIKIDAIKRNIDNLNYLNGELERNEGDLEYIDSKLDLFKDGDVLNFDNISKDDFEKILLMVNSNVSDIFKDMSCNYDGIIYIIEGIRKSISLQLTSEQLNAIDTFILGLKDKKNNLLETINNLTESKNRLPETNLTILMDNLDKYNGIVSEFENKLYLTEIDDISEALDFAEVSVEEKVDIFEYILKYNSSIHTEYLKGDFSESNLQVTNEEKTENTEFDLPKFDFETVNLSSELPDFKEIPAEEEKPEEKTIDDITFNLDKFNNEEHDEFSNVKFNEELPDLDNFTLNYELPTFDELPSEEEKKKELNTIELEDIIKKIDAKLKDMETVDSESIEEPENKTEEDIESQINNIKPIEIDNGELVNNEEIKPVSIPELAVQEEPQKPEISSVTVNELINKYTLSDIDITNNNLEDVDLMLKTLSDNNLLETFKNNVDLLTLMLNNNNSNNLEAVIKLIKDNLVYKNDDLSDVYNLLIETLPIIFTDSKVFESFEKNINFYKEKNINIINILDNYRELLIINHDILLGNYQKVLDYGLEVNSDNVKYLLYNKNVLTNLDYYIEAIGSEKGFLGKEDKFDGINYISKNPYKLNNGLKDMVLKLRYVSDNNGKIYSKPGILSSEISNPKVDVIVLPEEYLNNYFNGEYEFISKDDLNEVIQNNDIDMTVDSNINKLDEKYKDSELRYNIDNILISRIKTIRIYNLIKNKLPLKESLIVALTYNSVLKKTEYEQIVKAVENIVGGM